VPISNLTYTWAVVTGSGTISNTGLFMAGNVPGSFKNTILVAASQGSTVKVGYASVTITPVPGPLDHVVITPGQATLKMGGTKQFSAQGYDASNVTIPNLTYYWSVVASGGIINSTGLFTAGSVGGSFPNTVQVATTQATTQGAITKTANASITVETPGPLKRVVITPSTANLLAGGTQQFSAQGYDDNNVPIPNLTYTWAVVAGGGTISNTGLFTAGSVGGSFPNTVLVATSQGSTVKVNFASVSITPVPGPLDHVVITPGQATLKVGGTKQFSAQGYDASNVTIPNLTYSWFVVAGGGTISNSGLFTAGTVSGNLPNTVQVSTTQGTITNTANASVTVETLPTPTPTPTVISVSPNLGLQGQTFNSVIIAGTNFTGASALSFGKKITVNSFTVNSDTQIIASITITTYAAPGSRDVSVTTLGGKGSLANAFTVIQAPPTVTSLSSNYGLRGQTLDVSIYGNHFSGVTVVSFGAGVTVNNFKAFSETSIFTGITVAYTATPGLRDISVTTPGGTATLVGSFTISETAVSIKVNSPNGGESWAIGSNQKITWTSNDPNDKVKIQLSGDGGASWKTIISSTKNDGAEAWEVAGPPTNQAKIKVLSHSNTDVFDISDVNFVIPAPTIRVTSPNGGENLKIGTRQTITWTATDLTDKVKIQLSTDGGASWKTIISSTRNDGAEAWEVTGTATNQARIKVLSRSNPDIFDISDANFIISAPTIRVTSPNGGESWNTGTEHTITWTSTDLADEVKIELSRDGGKRWNTIKGSTSNDGSYTWKVNGQATNQARIRVLSKSHPAVFDISDANFTINRYRR